MSQRKLLMGLLSGLIALGLSGSAGAAEKPNIVAAALAGPRSPAAEPDRPNVIIVLADDLGWGDLSCYGGTIAATPRLDRMAQEGVRFTQAYVASPICSPSRCGIITGQFPGKWKITSYLQTRAGNKACEMADFLDPKAPSLPRALRQAGYATAHVGKWHLGGGRDVVGAPAFAAYGYDRGLGTYESPEPHSDITAKDWIWSADDKVKRWDRTQWMVDRTLEFLKDHPHKPCFINLWLDDTHTPWVPTAQDQTTNKKGGAAGKGDTRERLAKVLVEMDKQLGRMIDAIRDSKRPTLVIFLGDNGPLPTFQQSRTAGLRGSKLSLYEGGIRVPLIAWGPGLVKSGITNTETVFSALDFFPSLCKLCGAPLQKGYEPDGEDLAGALVGKEAATRKKTLFWEYGRNDTSFAYPKDGGNRSPNLAVRDGDWKLLVNSTGGKAELYNLAADPKETKDVAVTNPEVTKRLTDMVLEWRKSLP
jgi:arylsulfatase A-like enzyme